MTDIRERSGPGVRRTASAFFYVDYVEELNYPLSLFMTIAGVVAPLLPFFFISELVGDSPTVGGDYLTFTVIGLAATTMMTGAMSGFGGSLQNAFQRGTLEVFLVEPVPWTVLPLAMNQFQVVFGVMSGLIVFGVGALLGATFVTSGILAAVVINILGVIAATAIGIVSAAVLLLTLKSAPILRLYSLAASLLAGSLFSVDQLPTWARWLSYLLPHTYVINGTRSALMENPGSFDLPVSTAIIVLLVFDILFFPSGVYLFKRGLELARKMGTLGGY